MNIETITTENYELQVASAGDPDSPVAIHFTPGLGEHCQMPHVEDALDFFSKELDCYAQSVTAPGLFGSKLRGKNGFIYDYSTYRTTDAEIEFAQQQHTKNPKQIVVALGHSGGNRQAIYKAATLNHVKGVVSIFGALTWIRGNNEHDRTVEWPARGYKSVYVEHPQTKEVTEVRIPSHYTESAPAYDAKETVMSVRKPKLFIIGEYDSVALPEDIRKNYKNSPLPKKKVMLPSNHFYLSAEEARLQAEAIASMGEILGRTAVKSYSNPLINGMVNAEIAYWMEQKQFLPSQVGRRMLRASLIKTTA